jgi:hypothetical protein
LPESNIIYDSKNTKQELLKKIAQHTKNKAVNNYNLTTHSSTSTNSSLPNNNEGKLIRLTKIIGKPVSILPQVSYLRVESQEEEFFYSLINNSAHTNVAHLFSESDRRIPAEDNLTVLNGIVGTYPNAFFDINEQQLGDFISMIEQLKTEQDYREFKDKFAIRRTNPNFWQYADKLHDWYKKNQANSAGLLDFNRLENR